MEENWVGQEGELDMSQPRYAKYKHVWKVAQGAVYWVDIGRAQRMRLKFYQTRSSAIILHDTLTPVCIERMVSRISSTRTRKWWGTEMLPRNVNANIIGARLRNSSELGMLIRASWERVILICVRGWHQIFTGKKENINPMWKVLNKEVDLRKPSAFLDHVHFKHIAKHAEATEKLSCSRTSNISTWSYDVEGHARKCVERYCEWRTKLLNNCTRYQLHALMTTNSEKKNWNPWRTVRRLFTNCSEMSFHGRNW